MVQKKRYESSSKTKHIFQKISKHVGGTGWTTHIYIYINKQINNIKRVPFEPPLKQASVLYLSL